MSYDAAANAANESQKRIGELEAQLEEACDKIKQLRAEMRRAAQLIPCAGPVSRRIQVLMIEHGERVLTLEGELATLRAQAERDAPVIAAAEALEDWLEQGCCGTGNDYHLSEVEKEFIAAVRARRDAGEGEASEKV